MDSSPFHPDELAAQSRAGATAGGAGIRNFIPDQHRSFFAMLPYLSVATADNSGWPLATMLSARAMIERSDTFFVASRSRSGAGASGGADISHRGGRPGFVRVEGDTLSIPDFRGNRYFNTLGNLSGDPRAALLFVDFEAGDLLQLQGVVEIDWSEESARRYEGAERLWYFRMRRGWHRRAGSPVRGSFIDCSPLTLLTGTWSS